MSGAYQKWARQVRGLKPAVDRLLLREIAFRVDDSGCCALKMKDLCEVLELGRNALRDAIDRLLERQLLVVRCSSYRGTKAQAAHDYKLIRDDKEHRLALSDGYEQARRVLSREAVTDEGAEDQSLADQLMGPVKFRPRAGQFSTEGRSNSDRGVGQFSTEGSVSPAEEGRSVERRRVGPLADRRKEEHNTLTKYDRPSVSDDQGISDAALIAALRKAGGGKIAPRLFNARDLRPIRELLAGGCDLERDIVPVFIADIRGLKQELRTFAAPFIREKVLASCDARRETKAADQPRPPTVFADPQLARFAAALRPLISSDEFETSFASMATAPAGIDDDTWTLSLRSSYLPQRVRERFECEVTAALKASGLPFARIKFVTARQPPAVPSSADIAAPIGVSD